jgi:8-oxo-dGTP pyrophosphatase MutT (NUDIX family)
VPGGKLEVLEYALKPKDTSSHWYNVLENLLKREIKEEVNLEIKDVGYVTSMVYIRDDGIPTIIISLYAVPCSEDVRLCSALTDYQWVDLEEAKSYELIEGIYEEIEMLDNLLNKGQKKEWEKTLAKI